MELISRTRLAYSGSFLNSLSFSDVSPHPPLHSVPGLVCPQIFMPQYTLGQKKKNVILDRQAVLDKQTIVNANVNRKKKITDISTST